VSRTVVANPAVVHSHPIASPLAPLEVEVERHADHVVVRTRVLVERDAPYMAGHFPDLVVLPGVFMLEAAVRAAAHAWPHTGEPRLLAVRSMRFLAPALEGDAIDIAATVRPLADGRLDVDASCRRADRTVAARLRLELGEARDA
jgi:3-hydroxyacyl-[acyl-carrier-protein] dehydratase